MKEIAAAGAATPLEIGAQALAEIGSKTVDVRVLSFAQLLDGEGLPLGIDTYQRGFVWDHEKISQLKQDLADYTKEPDPKPPYYMGTILLHQNAENGLRYIIDGQQRLTALCVLHFLLEGRFPRLCAMEYSLKSRRNIQQAARSFQASPEVLKGIFDRIRFSVITVERLDLAFTFFDTQNNRGVRLDVTDLLKAYHLRAVGGADPAVTEALQNHCAKRWEGTQQGQPVMSSSKDFISHLFSKFLWRARFWTGGQFAYESDDALLEEFQKGSWKAAGDPDTLPVYRSRHNCLASALILKQEGHCEIHLNRISLSAQASDLPFAIRQPIQSGVGFFLYTEKYASLLRWLMIEDNESKAVQAFRQVEKTLLANANQIYLREVFLLASLIYVDQFGDSRLLEFALWLEHGLGAIRLEMKRVYQQAATRFLYNGSSNFLDVIANAYAVDQVIGYLKKHHHRRDVYASTKMAEIIPGEGVRGVYKAAVLTYFGQAMSGNVRDKEDWIANKVSEHCHGHSI